MECEGKRTRLNAFTIAVANSDQYGNNAHIAPGARVDDGLLDLTVVPPVSLFNALPLMCRLFSGTLSAGRTVWRKQSAHFAVEMPGSGTLHTDGETYDVGARVEFSVLPRSLRIMTPARLAGA